MTEQHFHLLLDVDSSIAKIFYKRLTFGAVR